MQFTVIKEETEDGRVALRVITELNDCVWAVGSVDGIKAVEDELRAICCKLGGRWLE